MDNVNNPEQQQSGSTCGWSWRLQSKPKDCASHAQFGGASSTGLSTSTVNRVSYFSVLIFHSLKTLTNAR